MTVDAVPATDPQVTVDAAAACPACAGTGLAVFHEQRGIPTNSCLLLATPEAALDYPTGDLRLAFCPSCGFVTNLAFDPSLSEYSARYEETQAFSAHFVAFAKELAARWVTAHDLEGRSVLEIGCGKGEFLTWMVEAGAGLGVGIDPSAHPERIVSPVADRLRWITDFYSDAYADLDADAIVCRHTLEHIQPVGEFMRMVRRNVKDRVGTPVLFELPDVARVLTDVAFWDVYYEHCSYFSAGSLARLFRRCGFDVQALALEYDGQYLTIEARPSPSADPSDTQPFPIEDDLSTLARAATSYSRRCDSLLGAWHERLRAVRERGGRTVIWGAGSKGVSFLTNLRSRGGADLVDLAVDINPFKWDKYIAGTGHRIVGPDALVEHRPDLVIAMNEVYVPEIRARLDALAVGAELVAV